MNMDELQVYSDMLGEPEDCEEALVALMAWGLKDIESTTFGEQLGLVLAESSLSYEDKLSFLSRTVTHLSGLLVHSKLEVRRCSASLLLSFSFVASRIVGNTRAFVAAREPIGRFEDPRRDPFSSINRYARQLRRRLGIQLRRSINERS